MAGIWCLAGGSAQHQYKYLNVLKGLEGKVWSLKTSDHTAYISLGAKGSVSKGIILNCRFFLILVQSIKQFSHLC